MAMDLKIWFYWATKDEKNGNLQYSAVVKHKKLHLLKEKNSFVFLPLFV